MRVRKFERKKAIHSNDYQSNLGLLTKDGDSRAILIHPDLVILWKQIGYVEICEDVNDLVLQGALLILFPPTPPHDWICPSVSDVIKRLKDLIELGFELKYSVIVDALHMFEDRLDVIGDLLWNVFCAFRSDEPMKCAYKFFQEALKPERNLKKDHLLNFLKSKFDYHEQIIKKIVVKYFEDEKIDNMESRKKSLIFSPKVYRYILNTYGRESELTLECFKDISALKTYIDDASLNSEADVMSPFTQNSILTTFNLYVKEMENPNQNTRNHIKNSTLK
ncbi:2670_t:CDS:2 [Funneliformis geosporum]|nr:2670_t:CDS:2 [Funneliformis geosporum]